MKRLILLALATIMLGATAKADYTVSTEPQHYICSNIGELEMGQPIETAGVNTKWGEVSSAFFTSNFEVMLRGAPYLMRVKDIYPCRKAEVPVTGLTVMTSRVRNTAVCVTSGHSGINFLKKVTVLYTPIGDTHPFVFSQSCSDVKTTLYNNDNGMDIYQAVITPKFPVQNIYLEAQNTSNTTDCQLADLTKGPVRGYIILALYVDCYSSFNSSETVGEEFAKQYEAGKAALTYDQADVNRDGSINATDVVAVYNRIINGSAE